MLRIAALLLTALVAACTSVSYDFGDLAPESSPATRASAPLASGARNTTAFRVAVRNPRFGDRKPHPWTGRAPWTYAVHGTDASKYQGPVDWKAAKAAGISFAFVKATEGGDRLDDYFHEHWRGTRAAGIPRSAYHFFYFCRPVAAEHPLVDPHIFERRQPALANAGGLRFLCDACAPGGEVAAALLRQRRGGGRKYQAEGGKRRSHRRSPGGGFVSF